MTTRVRQLAVVLVLAACCVAFVPGLAGPFMLDDIGSVLGARPGGLSLAELADIAWRDRSGLYGRPLSTLSFGLNHYLSRNEPYGFKLVNLLVHALCALGAYWLARRLLPRLVPGIDARATNSVALLAAALWCAHPLQVSTVLYVVQRMAQLATLFSFLAIGVFVHWWAREPRPFVGRTLAAIAVLTLLALASKESGALIPLLALACLVAMPHPLSSAADRRYVMLACAIPLVLGGAVALAIMPSVIAGYEGREYTLVERLLTEARALFFYLGSTFWPDPARMGLYHDGFAISRVDAAGSYAWPVALCGLVVLALILRRRVPLFTFATAWFLAAHALESTFIPLELVFEHRNYLASFGPALFAAWCLHAAVRQASPAVRLLPFALVAILAALTVQRSLDWSSEARFTATEVQRHPESPRAQMAATSIALASGQWNAALAHAKEVRRLRPDLGWSMLIDAHLACAFRGRQVDWAGLERYFGEGDPSVIDTGHLDPLGRYFLRPNGCPGLDASRVERLLAIARDRQVELGHAARAEELYVVSSYISRGRGDVDGTIALLERGADANPRGTVALFELALYRLNAGRIDGTDEVIARLRRVVRANGDDIEYQVDELEQFLSEARGEEADRQ